MTPSDVDAMTALAILSIGVPIMAAVSLFLYFRRRKKNNHYWEDDPLIFKGGSMNIKC